MGVDDEASGENEISDWTKKPWNVYDLHPNGATYEVGPEGTNIGNGIATIYRFRDDDEANVHLIAQAPELRRVAESMAKALERLDSGHPLIADWVAVDAKA